MEQSLKGAAADLRGVVVADCGHYVPEEQPLALLDVLLPFLAG
jgi:pimeloyl-ACP methyl ester carboxylesterase